MSEMWWGCLGLYLGMFWGVLRCSIVLKGVSGGSVLLGWNQGSAIIPFWNNFKRQDLFHPTHLRPQNIKTSLCKLSKNYWVMLYFVSFRFVREKLQSTVSLDHPVSASCECAISLSDFLIRPALIGFATVLIMRHKYPWSKKVNNQYFKSLGHCVTSKMMTRIKVIF